MGEREKFGIRKAEKLNLGFVDSKLFSLYTRKLQYYITGRSSGLSI